MLKYTNANGQSITFDGTEYYLEKLEGCSGPPVDVQIQKAPFQDGATHIDTVLEPRLINIVGSVAGDSVAELRGNLVKVFNPKLSGALTYTYDGYSYLLSVQVETPPLPLSGEKNRGPKFQRFTISLIAPDPLFYSPAVIHSLTASFAVNNAGDVATPVELMIEASGAAVVKPKITNTDTGEYIELDYTIADGEEVYINTAFGKKEITLVSDDTNLFNKLTSASTMFSLPVGTSNLTYTLTSGGRAGELRFYPRHLGV